MTIKTYHGDMNTQLCNVEDNSIDLLLTDPPYNISSDGAKPVWIDKATGENKNTIHSQKFSENFDDDWDAQTHEDFLLSLDKWSKSWYPKLRKGATFAIFISDKYISYLWNIMEENGFEPKRVFNWKKPAAVPFNRSVNPVSGCEYILWGIKPGGKRTFNSDAVKGTIVERYSLADKVSSILYKYVKDDSTSNLDECFKHALKDAKRLQQKLKQTDDIVHCVVPNTITYSGGLGKKIHPTQKPEELLRYFIELCSNKGDTILDTFAGSGSTGKASENSGRNCILIERDSKMFSLMEQQFDNRFQIVDN